MGSPVCYSWKGGQLPAGDEGPLCRGGGGVGQSQFCGPRTLGRGWGKGAAGSEEGLGSLLACTGHSHLGFNFHSVMECSGSPRGLWKLGWEKLVSGRQL